MHRATIVIIETDGIMEYRVLKYFLAVAREENITRASELLHISQPALSRQLMQLEEELGAQLFIRGKRNITLTDAGMLLRRRAQEIVDLTEKTENEFREGEKLGGIISIGSGESETMRFLAGCMQSFHEMNPGVTFDIYSNNADFIKERLEKGLLDIGVLLAPSDISRYEYIRLPHEERWGALLPTKCPLTAKEYVTAADLADRNIFMPRRGVVQGVAEWFGEYYGNLKIFATHNLLYNAAMLVDCGIGTALTIEGAAALYKNDNITFRPFYPELRVSSVLVWKKYQPTSPAVSAFIEHIKCKLGMTDDKK